MFLDNKYTKWYFSIIDKAVSENRIKRKGDGSNFERHHIIPRCLGGTNDRGNLVVLTYKEHFLCHWLLIKMVAGTLYVRKMQHAFVWMANRVAKNSSQYAIGRKHYRLARCGIPLTEIHKNKVKESLSKLDMSECRKAMSEKLREMVWITDGVSSLRIYRDSDIPEGWYPGRPYKKRAPRSDIHKLRLQASRPHTKIIFDGCEYPSMHEVRRKTGLAMATIKKRSVLVSSLDS
jgi:hypothetical protein